LPFFCSIAGCASGGGARREAQPGGAVVPGGRRRSPPAPPPAQIRVFFIFFFFSYKNVYQKKFTRVFFGCTIFFFQFFRLFHTFLFCQIFVVKLFYLPTKFSLEKLSIS